MRFPMPFFKAQKVARSIVAVLVALAIGSAAFPSDADLADDLKKLQEEQEQVKAEKEANASNVDVATAEVEEVTAALAMLNGQVNEQESNLVEAEDRLDEAEARHAEATAAVKIKTAEIELLKSQVADKAISAFVGRGARTGNPVMQNVDPNEAVRRRSLVLSVTQQDLDITESLRAAQEELAIQQAIADDAQIEAGLIRDEMADQLVALEGLRDQQASLAAEAELRLDARLAEQAILEEMEAGLAVDIKEANDELARQAALAAARSARNNPAPSNSNTKYPSSSEVVKVQGFWVHIDIAANLEDMLNHAAADGINFGGWGYRSHERQIELRRRHCGTSNYAIWQMASSQCRPPTARPGSSQHELGKAIDFTYGGQGIGTRSNPGYKWLAAHAHKYGLYNLPSEPWHWSVNGR